MLPVSWAEVMLTTVSRSFQKGTLNLCRSKICKVICCQSWRFEKKSAAQPPWSWTLHAWGLGLSPEWFDHPKSLMDHNFAGSLWPKRLTVPLWKDLDLVVCIAPAQETGKILKIGFDLSKWPYLQRACVIGGCIFFSMAAECRSWLECHETRDVLKKYLT